MVKKWKMYRTHRAAPPSERTPHDDSYCNSQIHDAKSDHETQQGLDTKTTDWPSVAKWNGLRFCTIWNDTRQRGHPTRTKTARLKTHHKTETSGNQSPDERIDWSSVVTGLHSIAVCVRRISIYSLLPRWKSQYNPFKYLVFTRYTVWFPS
jgi:hypothetical protein